MFEGIRKKLARAANEEEEIVFKPYEEEKPAPVAEPKEEAPAAQNSSIEGNNIELKVVRPESIDEIFSIADYLIEGCTVVLNLEMLDAGIITRMLDFLNGVTYTKGGEIKNVSQGTYIITPDGININR
jgi:cell division inhibitor SepF